MMQNKIKIAVTGGIGSGKSTVMKVLGEYGYPVISCDEIYSELLNKKSMIDRIASAFKDVVRNDEIDRKKLAEIVFANDTALKKLNSITHPEIMNELIRRAEEYIFCFCEVPLLFESGYENIFDDIIVVLRDFQNRISAVVKRDGISENEVLNRIKQQFEYDNLNFAEYYVIYNSGNLEELESKTLKIITEIKEKYFKKI